ncbi:MAG: PaaI family thioesterase [Novosphingobium sp.]
MTVAPVFFCEPSPEHPGWNRWRLGDESRYNEAVLGPFLVRVEDEKARVRIFPRHEHTNNGGNVHGAVTLGLIDIALFAAVRVLRDIDALGSVTVGLETQFIGSGNPAKPLDAVVEVLRETRRLVFLRGLVEQDGDLVAAFSATTRKPVSAHA